MRKEFWEDLKGCLRAKLVKARADWKYSQEEMAEALDMSTRAYAALERGESCCGLVTFLFFLHRCAPERYAALAEALTLPALRRKGPPGRKTCG